jgi:hypothetical protein
VIVPMRLLKKVNRVRSCITLHGSGVLGFWDKILGIFHL